MPEPITWKEVLKPSVGWLGRHLPAILFNWFYHYERRDLEEDIRLVYRADDPATIDVPRYFRPPYFEFSIEAFNLSPYFDVRVIAVHSFLTVIKGNLQSVFADFSRWDAYELPRRASQLLKCEFWLNEFQAPILEAFVRGEADINAYVNVRTESKVGIAQPFKVFNLTPSRAPMATRL